MTKLVVSTIVGARPQLIKAFPVSKALAAARFDNLLIHTGQHYDYALSQIFLDELNLPEPWVNLEVGSGGHGQQTGEMLIRLERVLAESPPDMVVVFGDTNSTLAAALVASKLHIPITHVEAGLRSFNRKMPEEINRVLTDHCSDLLFAPTEQAVKNLGEEGITAGVHNVGDVMVDSMQAFHKLVGEHANILTELALEPESYHLVTVHRPRNTNNLDRLEAIMTALNQADKRIVFPVHPRTRSALARLTARGFSFGSNLTLTDPVGYIEMLALESNCSKILTDSGGVQKEAYLLRKPCITLREETEWIETVEQGWNMLVAANPADISRAIREFNPAGDPPPLYGDGKAAERIVSLLVEYLEQRRS